MSDPDPTSGVSPSDSGKQSDTTAGKYNTRNPAVKRILREIREMASDTSLAYHAEAVESDIFEWHFAILGAEDSEFESGIYHGRVLLPPEYPFKPPSFVLLTPSGRFQVNEKICLSITQHHPEHWQPSWSVRTALTAVRAFMPSPAEGAVGSLDYTKEERAVLANKSRAAAPAFGGSDERTEILQRVHLAMLAKWEESQRIKESETEGEGETSGNTASTPGADAETNEARRETDTAETAGGATSDETRLEGKNSENETATTLVPSSSGASGSSSSVVPDERRDDTTLDNAESENTTEAASVSGDSVSNANVPDSAPGDLPSVSNTVNTSNIPPASPPLAVPVTTTAVPSTLTDVPRTRRRSEDTEEVKKLKKKLEVTAGVLLLFIFLILARRVVSVIAGDEF